MISLGFEGIGTWWQIDTPRPIPASLTRCIRDRVEAFDATYSRFRTDSLVSAMARQPGSYRFPPDAEPLFNLYRRLYDATGGAITPLVGGTLEHLGYDASYRLTRQPGTVTVPAWDDIMTVHGRVITIRKPVILDVGAAGKGFLVDLVADLLSAAGATEYVIDASGDLIHRGQGTECIGLEDPRTSGKVIGTVNLTNTALCASATSRRAWGDGLHHIIDPSTGEPATRVLASWVRHPRCAVADGLATALFVADPGVLADHFSFSYARLLADGRGQLSSNFDGEIFTSPS